MRMLTFAGRCAKEILRDPINLGFGLGFPLVLLLLLSAMQANIPVNLFEIDTLTPGITVFGLSFMTLFSATLVAKDRESAFLQRLYTLPLTGIDFILGYMLPILPIALGQTILCYLAAIPLGLTFSINIVYAVMGILPMAIPSSHAIRQAVSLTSGQYLTPTSSHSRHRNVPHLRLSSYHVSIRRRSGKSATVDITEVLYCSTLPLQDIVVVTTAPSQ